MQAFLSVGFLIQALSPHGLQKVKYPMNESFFGRYTKSDQYDKGVNDMSDQPIKQGASDNIEEKITQQGKSPREVQADLLAGEPDDLAIDFTNIIDYRGGGSN